VQDGSGREVLSFDSANANLVIGAVGNEGDVQIRDDAGNVTVHLDGHNANLIVGAVGNEGDVQVRDDAGNVTVHLDGQNGDVILSNGDAAEHFDVAEHADAEPGSVMVLNADGRIEPSCGAYDTKVVGVISGAGNYRPGIVLDHHGEHPSRAPISVLGKVSCKVDASFGRVQPGDLLTSSPTPGHAMKVAELRQAHGSLIGKALTPLDEGRGLVDMLIALR
jgi:hypothetical protein